MNSYWLYKEEVGQRTLLAQAGRRKRRHTGGCRLPSDSLTVAQWRERNGPVIVYRIQKTQKMQKEI